MPKKTTPKTRRKVTQLDDALPDTPITMKTIYYAVVNIHGRLNRMEFETAAVKALLKSPAPEPKEQEPWVPKVGAYYTATADLGWYKKGRVYRYDHHGGRTTEHLAMCDKPNSSVTFAPEHHCAVLRESTQAEIDAHLEAERRAEEESKARQLRIQQLKKELAELEANAEP